MNYMYYFNSKFQKFLATFGQTRTAHLVSDIKEHPKTQDFFRVEYPKV